ILEGGPTMTYGSMPPSARRRLMAPSRCGPVRAAGLAAAMALLLALPAAADDNFPGPGSYGDRLSPPSTWEEILKTPGAGPESPRRNCGRGPAPLAAVWVGGTMGRTADPRQDNGVRLPVAQVVAQGAAPTTTRYAVERADPFSVGQVAFGTQG